MEKVATNPEAMMRTKAPALYVSMIRISCAETDVCAAGTAEDKISLAQGESDIADRANPSGIQTGQGSSK